MARPLGFNSCVWITLLTANVTQAYADWTSPVSVTTSNYAAEPAICTFQNRVFVAWRDMSLDGIHFREWDGDWQPEELASVPQSNEYDSKPRIAADSSGNVHCVWVRRATTAYKVCYARRTGTAWQAATDLAITSLAYGENICDIAVDHQDHLHVVWEEQAGQDHQIRYRYFDGTAWVPVLAAGGEIVTGSTNAHRPRVAVDPSNGPHVVWDQAGSGRSDVYYSMKAAGNWLPSAVNLTAVSYGLAELPRIASDTQGRMHVVWTDASSPDEEGVYYRMNSDESWSPLLAQMAVNILGDDNSWGEADVAADADCHPHAICGGLHLTYTFREAAGVWKPPTYATSSRSSQPSMAIDDNGNIHVAYVIYAYTVPRSLGIFYVKNEFVPPPGPVAGFVAQGGIRQVVLSWTNPSDSQFAGTMIRLRADAFPADPSDGILVLDRPNTPGSTDTYTHDNLPPGGYYYAAFAHNSVPLYATPVTAATFTTHAPGDFDGDGDVDRDDLGCFMGCLTGSGVPQSDPACADTRMDADDDVDQADFGLFQRCLSGKNVPADPSCGN